MMWFAVRSACSKGLSFSFGEGSYNILLICHFVLISKFVCIPIGCTLLNKLNGKCMLLKWFAIVPGGFWLWLHEIGCNLIACNKVGSNHFTCDCHQPLTTSQAILIFPSWPEVARWSRTHLLTMHNWGIVHLSLHCYPDCHMSKMASKLMSHR